MGVELKSNSIELGIVTRDADAALKFYRDTLGLPYERKWDMPGGNVMHRLKCGDCIVKIVVHAKPPAADAPKGGIQASTGYRYFTMRISNMESVLEDAKKAGYNIPVPKTEIMPNVSIAMVEDPDGNWVELVQ